jgi:hypothetical protein
MKKFQSTPRKALFIVFLIFSSVTGITSWSQSSDATLKELLVAGVRIDNFSSAILSYNIVLDYGTTIPPIVSATASSSHATVFITQAPSVTGAATVLVTAQDGVNKLTYTVNFSVFPIAQTNAFLKDLLAGGITVSGFDRKTTSYNVQLPFGTTDPPVVSALVDEPHATTVITQAPSVTGSAVVEVTAQDGTTKMTYTINFSLAPPSADATLSDLKIGPNTVSGFNSNIMDYNVLLPPTTSVVPVISVVTTEPHASAVIVQADSVNGTAIIVVTAQDTITTKTYSVHFSVASTDATLSDLKIDTITVADFDPNTTEYNVVLPAGTSVVPVVTATVTEPHAVASITQAGSVHGSATVEVTAQDGTTVKIYVVNFSVPTGIDTDNADQLRISMQDRKISIQSAGDIGFVQVTDIQGKLMYNRKVDSTETSVDTESWTPGIYIFHISTRNEVITRKISVIK